MTQTNPKKNLIEKKAHHLIIMGYFSGTVYTKVKHLLLHFLIKNLKKNSTTKVFTSFFELIFFILMCHLIMPIVGCWWAWTGRAARARRGWPRFCASASWCSWRCRRVMGWGVGGPICGGCCGGRAWSGWRRSSCSLTGRRGRRSSWRTWRVFSGMLHLFCWPSIHFFDKVLKKCTQ